MDEISSRIRWAVYEHWGGTQAGLARQMNVQRQMVNRWMSPKGDPPREKYLQQIADITGVPVAWLRYGGPLPQLHVAEETRSVDTTACTAEQNRLAAFDVIAATVRLVESGRFDDLRRRIAAWLEASEPTARINAEETIPDEARMALDVAETAAMPERESTRGQAQTRSAKPRSGRRRAR